MSLLYITRSLLNLELSYLTASLNEEQHMLALSRSRELWNDDSLNREMIYAICLYVLLND